MYAESVKRRRDLRVDDEFIDGAAGLPDVTIGDDITGEGPGA